MEQNKVLIGITPRPEKKTRFGEYTEEEKEIERKRRSKAEILRELELQFGPDHTLKVHDSSDDDNSSDDDWMNPGPSEKHMSLYLQELEESQGYDISECPHAAFHMVQPFPFKDDPEGPDCYDKFAKLATDQYNIEKNAQLQFLKVIKVNEAYMFRVLYITFEAKDGADGDAKIYQTRVHSPPGREPEIEEVRLKPSAT